MNKMSKTQKATKPEKTFSQLCPKELPATQLHQAIDSHNNAQRPPTQSYTIGVIVALFLFKKNCSRLSLMGEPMISFDTRMKRAAQRAPWPYNDFVSVGFFEDDCPTWICLTSISDDNFEELLSWVDDDSEYLYAGLECCPEGQDIQSRPCIFEIGSSNGALVIRHPTYAPASIPLLDFMNTHKFYMNDVPTACDMLQQLYGNDIDLSRLTEVAMGTFVPNVPDQLYEWFKSGKLRKSNWELPRLMTHQVLYAAFDVMRLHKASQGCQGTHNVAKESTRWPKTSQGCQGTHNVAKESTRWPKTSQGCQGTHNVAKEGTRWPKTSPCCQKTHDVAKDPPAENKQPLSETETTETQKKKRIVTDQSERRPPAESRARQTVSSTRDYIKWYYD